MNCPKCGKPNGDFRGLCYYCQREENGKGIPNGCVWFIILFILLIPIAWAILKFIAVVKWILT